VASIDKVGPKKYRARYRTPDGASRSGTFEKKADAEQFLTSAEQSKLDGSYVDRAAGRVAFRVYVAEHLEGRPWRPRTRMAADTSLAHALAVFGERLLSSVRPSQVQAFVSGLELAPSTVRTVVQHVRTVFRSAVRDGLVVRDPTVGVKLPRADAGAIVPPSDQMVRAIYEAAAPAFRPAVLFGVAVGLRQAEASALTADRVGWLRRTVRVDRQWSQAGGWTPPKTPPQSGLSRWRLRSAGVDPGGLLVQWGEGDRPVGHAAWGRAMRDAVGAAGLSDVRFRDLRHHFASKLIAAGCSVKAVQAALSHEKASTTLDTYGISSRVTMSGSGRLPLSRGRRRVSPWCQPKASGLLRDRIRYL
jgi:integrase